MQCIFWTGFSSAIKPIMPFFFFKHTDSKCPTLLQKWHLALTYWNVWQDDLSCHTVDMSLLGKQMLISKGQSLQTPYA